MASAGYDLRKWLTNVPELLQDLPGEYCEQPRQFDTSDSESFIKVLGIQWDPSSDTLSYKLNVPSDQTVTKRLILSTIARLYDPCGYCIPVILRFKNLLQGLFKDGLHWDEDVPNDTVRQWNQMISDLQCLNHLRISRCVTIKDAITISLHGFGDASEAGYAACIYLRTEDSSGRTMVKLLLAKSKVAPMKTKQTIPKLELSAAHLVTKLLNHVAETYENSIRLQSINAWSDSSIVLSWLQSEPHTLQMFECNRVQDIHNSKRSITRRHIPSEHNPADCASRGITAQELVHHDLWWNPEWLTKPKSTWPQKFIDKPPVCLPGLKKTVHITFIDEPWHTRLLQRVSTFTKLNNVTSYIMRYSRNLRTPQSNRMLGPLSVDDIRQSIKFWIKTIQASEFSKELELMKIGKRIPTSLRKLNVFLDSEGIFRVGGRLRHSTQPYGRRHPILLPKNHQFIQLLIKHYHKIHCHVATNGLMAILRREYWIPSMKRQVSKIIRKCIRCHRFDATALPPFMADLPSDRVTASRPFAGIATDFAGPFLVKSSLLRNAKAVKAYLCVFICLTTKAVHLEAVSKHLSLLSQGLSVGEAFHHEYALTGGPIS